MEITEVKVFPVQEEKLRAFVSIVFNDCFMVNDIKVISGRDGFFISMPSRRKKNGKFKDVAHPLNNETRQRIEQRILAEYDRVVGGGAERRAVAAEVAAEQEQVEAEPVTPESESNAIAGDKSLEEVAEAHLRDSFWEA